MSAGSQLVVQADINWLNFGLRIQVTTATYVDDPFEGALICSGAVRATGISARNAQAARKLTQPLQKRIYGEDESWIQWLIVV